MTTNQVANAHTQNVTVMLGELQEGLISTISVGLLIVSGLAAAIYLQAHSFDSSLFGFACSLVLEAVLILQLNKEKHSLARALFLIGPILSLLGAALASPHEFVAYLAVLIVIGNSVIDPIKGLYAAVGTSIILVSCSSNRELLVAPLLITWLAAGIMWCSSRALYTTLGWAWHAEQRSSRLLEQLRDRQGELNRTLVALTEATARIERANRELSIARREAEDARQIKAQFAANISHELRTPLNLIIGFSEMMVQSPEVYGPVKWTPALRTDTREIHRSARHLLGLIDDILDLSRVDAQKLVLHLEVLDPRTLIEEAVSMASGLLRNKDIELRTNLPDSLPRLSMDRVRMRQVLINLLHNAVRFTDKGYIELDARVTQSELLFSVTDTGVGISPDDLQRIFEVFGQAKDGAASNRGGTGLGLAICQEFVRLHGGRIEVASELGIGSTFRVSLPLIESRQMTYPSYYVARRWASSEAEQPLAQSVFVVGGDPHQVLPIARSMAGYRTVPIESIAGLDALVETEHPAGILCFSDNPTSQIDTARILDAAGRDDLPLIVLDSPDRSLATPVELTDYIVKPVQRGQLLDAIHRVCAHPSSVLTVDDDPGFVALVERMLRSDMEHVQVLKAYSGEEALEYLGNQDVELILLDLNMPQMNGLELLQQIRLDPKHADVPVIVLSASGYEDKLYQWASLPIEILRQTPMSSALLGKYLRGLLETAPPDYTRASTSRNASKMSF